MKFQNPSMHSSKLMLCINKRTMMVLYRSPEQTDLHTYISVEVSAKFTALNFIALHPHPHQPPTAAMFFSF